MPKPKPAHSRPTKNKLTKGKAQISARPPKTVAEPRRLKAKPSRLRQPRQQLHTIKLPSAWCITKKTADLLWGNKKLFGAIALVYALLTVILVQGLTSGVNAVTLKSTLQHLAHGDWQALLSNLGIFAVLVSSAASTTSPASGAYQFLLALITSLAVIWAVRQRLSGNKIRIRDAYYQGMYPIVPFILILLLICVQLLPFVIGAKLYAIVITNGIAAHLIERIFWLALFIVLALWSLYMITSSVFGLYIVTLPDMAPLTALRSAKGIVRSRRWVVLRKILWLPLTLLIITAVIMLPIIALAASLAQWVLFLLSMLGLVVVNAYMYTLYRELLNE